MMSRIVSLPGMSFGQREDAFWRRTWSCFESSTRFITSKAQRSPRQNPRSGAERAQEFPQLLNISRLSDETTFEVGKLACCQLRHSAAVTHLAECHASVTLEAVPAQVGL